MIEISLQKLEGNQRWKQNQCLCVSICGSHEKTHRIKQQEVESGGVRSISRKCRDLDALGARDVRVVMKVGIVVTVAVVHGE